METTAVSKSIDQEIKFATEGLEGYFLKHLKEKVSRQNALLIAQYIASMRIETNISDNHRRGIITSLKLLSQYLNNKSFIEMTKNDILSYLQYLKKSDDSDIFHKWVSTYNLRLVIFLRFFKWVHNSSAAPSERVTPNVVANIPLIKRKEKSCYQPSDLWTEEDHALFLKYCVNSRDRCYHAMAIDTSCRPHELLKLRIKDIAFKHVGDRQYAEILVNGKTGSRIIPLLNSIPYIKDWIDDHPYKNNPNATLICGIGKGFGKHLSRYAIYDIYERYKKKTFPSLILDSSTPEVDKIQISTLMKKPFNPYILRHSALTEKASFLKEHVLRQHAGWSMSSKMPQVYIHWFGNESSKTLLELYGITNNKKAPEKLKPKQCPNCNEPNSVDSKFCSKCRMVLKYDHYLETLEGEKKKANEIEKIKKEMEIMKRGQLELYELLNHRKDLFSILQNE